MRINSPVLIPLLLVVIGSSALAPAAEGQYRPMPQAPTPSVSLGFGIGVFSFGDVTRPPACAQLGLACDTSSSTGKPTTAVFGGGFWIAGHNRQPLGFALEFTGYAQPWPVKGTSATARGINDIAFVLAGPRMNFQTKKSGNPFIKALLGFASSDRSPGGVAVIVAGGADGALLCHETATCVIGIEIGYRRVLGDPYLSGFQSILRVGVGF